MWTMFAFAAALSLAPGQADQLSFVNVRSVTGYFGAERPSNRLLPGDIYLLVFDIEGFKVDANGKIRFRMAMQVTDSRGKLQFGRQPEDREVAPSLGGNRVPASSYIEIGTDQPPGEYTVSMTVTDLTSKASAKLARKFEVLPKGFGVVRPIAFINPQMTDAVPLSGMVGEQRFVNCTVVGFERDTATKPPNLVVEMHVLDESGRQVAKPLSFLINQDVPENASSAFAQFPLTLNRPGKYTLELQATDQISKKKTARVSLPLTSVEQKSSRSTTGK
jgi:hypothetical protein